MSDGLSRVSANRVLAVVPHEAAGTLFLLIGHRSVVLLGVNLAARYVRIISTLLFLFVHP